VSESKLKARRAELGFSLRDVEAITEGAISNAYLSQLENGKIKTPSIAVVAQLSAAYAVPADVLIEWLTGEITTHRTVTCPMCGQAIRTNTERPTDA